MLLKEYKASIEDVANYKITNAKLGEILGTSSQNISKRIKCNSELTVSELSKLERVFGLFHFEEHQLQLTNSLNRINVDISEAFETWTTRLQKIQIKNNLSDKDMACILGITPPEYDDILADNPEPSFKIIRNLIENFDVDLNWLFAATENTTSHTNSDILNKLPQDKFQKLLNLLDE